MAYSREAQRRYASTANGRERRRAASERYRASKYGKEQAAILVNSLQYKARTAANNAVRAGKLVPQPCEGCGTSEGVQKHHHHGYEPEHWLCVRWLCRRCHTDEHLGE